MKSLTKISALCLALAATSAFAAPMLYNMVDGSPLDFEWAMEEGRDTEAVRVFLDTGENIYNETPEFLPVGEELFAGMCSGCHGHYGEGKIGPGLNDDYWSYMGNETDEGFFSSIYGGLTGQMGPMWGSLTLDEMLLVMAWTRHLYTGDPKDATWLTPEKRAGFTSFTPAKASIPAEEDEEEGEAASD
ncbi:cytochrome c(L), periplasmic [Neomegalonema sp.]|uniref:cytochrome c(L), periplasmic n=1 Tax=Neomegalonema sp. TaxID=2039713 RepID=UPI002602B771|nr:cytochrome c(L), periplasmic [Neomegalonema sp.]MDD2869755.1 cytochrome c(L), periplasmic [Neomegalonema sp.]